MRDRILEELILNGATPVGELLPPVSKLAERYGVSRITVRASLRSLQDAGLVVIRNGVGATVLPLPSAVTHGFDRLVSLETLGSEAGKVVASERVSWFEGPADPITAEKLGLAPGAPVSRAERVKTVDGRPGAWFVDTVPEQVLSAQLLRDGFDGSVLDTLIAHRQLDVAYEDADLVPVRLEPSIAGKLDVAVGTLALYVNAVTCSGAGERLEWAQSWLLPEHFSFSVRRRTQVGANRVPR